MPEATRAVALQEAVKVSGASGYKDVLLAAEAFRAFIEDTAAKVPASTTTPAKAAKAAAKPVKTEEQLVAEATAHAADEDDVEAQKQECAGIIDALLKGGRKAKAIALLAKFGAKSLSSVPVESYGDFIIEGGDLLLTE
jgi:tryptophanyl-tRNA synthetase